MTLARTLRILLGLGLVLALLLLLRGPAEPEIEPGSTLVLELAGEYAEAQEAPLVTRLLGEGQRPFVGLLSRFAMARRDDRIDTVVLRIGGLGIGWAKAQELRSAVADLRKAGRRVVAHVDVFGIGASREYYIATAADELQLAPGSAVALVGLAAEYMHLGGMWEKLGVEIDVTKVGRYKSATEALAGTGMSDAAREMANSLLDSVFDQFVAGIAEGRGLEASQVRAAIDAGPVRADELLQLGLIDGVADFHDLLAEQPGEVVEPDEYAKVSAASVGFDPVAQVALVYGAGNVVSGSRRPTNGSAFASRSVSEALLEAAVDPAVDAIIFRIDSPGGSAMASEEIWQAVRRARAEGGKPIVASLSDVAASGGYYVVTGADAIVSAPGTLTGSIGVYMLRPVLGGLLDNLGIHIEALTRGANADVLLSSEAPSPAARERMQKLADDTYALFTSRVAEGRSLDGAAVERVAQGRVWTGEQALASGLVDELGGMTVAVARVRSLLELEADADVALLPYPVPQSLAQQVGSLLEGRAHLAARLRVPELFPFAGLIDTLATWLRELPPNTPLLVPPVVVDIR
jgi:protease-4